MSELEAPAGVFRRCTRDPNTRHELRQGFSRQTRTRPSASRYRGNGSCREEGAGFSVSHLRQDRGSGIFRGLVREYVRRYPSVNGDLNGDGEALPRFVAGLAHTKTFWPCLTSRMEWLAHRAVREGRAAV